MARAWRLERFVMRFAAALALFAALALAPLSARAGSLSVDKVTMVAPGGAGTTAETVARMVAPGMSRMLGVPVAVETMEATEALRRLEQAPADGSLIAVADPLTLALYWEGEANNGRNHPLLTSIAKITDGLSYALVVPEASPIKDWPAFASAARLGRLRLAHFGYGTTFGIAVTMMEQVLGVRFVDVSVTNTADLLGATADGRAEAALVTSYSVGRTVTGMRPLLTFGADRYPGFESVATLSEVSGDRRYAFTSSLALFGPPGMRRGAQETIEQALMKVGRDPAMQKAALAEHLPLNVGDESVLDATLDRDQRVVGRIGYVPGLR